MSEARALIVLVMACSLRAFNHVSTDRPGLVLSELPTQKLRVIAAASPDMDISPVFRDHRASHEFRDGGPPKGRQSLT